MYEDTWYSYAVAHAHDDLASQPTKHRRKESLLQQPTDENHISDATEPIRELFEDASALKSPPKATLAKRAKSYSNFYEAAIHYLGKSSEIKHELDVFEATEPIEIEACFEKTFQACEEELLDASQQEYRLYKDQLTLSERHLDSLLDDTSSALDLLASLSESFKLVESQTTAFQAQCEDLLAEQKQLRDLANEIGTDLQYYAYLEPLTRRLNTPGSGRLVQNDDFLDMLRNLNTCIDFMDQHPLYRDSTVYKTRYISLLERSLNIVQVAFSSALRDVTDDVTKQLKSKEQNETAQYILLFGKYEALVDKLGAPIDKLLHSLEFAFGRDDDDGNRDAYIEQWHELYKQLVQAYLKSREPLGPLVMKNLRKLTIKDAKSDTEFERFARNSVQYVFDICRNELKLIETFFGHGPLLAQYSTSNAQYNYAEILEQHRLSHVKALYTVLMPHLNNADLRRVVDLVNWVETMCLTPAEGEEDADLPNENDNSAAQIFLSDHLWPLSDTLFIKAATDFEHFRPTPEDLKFEILTPQVHDSGKLGKGEDPDVQIGSATHTDPAVSRAYPTVKTAVTLLIMYNDSKYERPRKGDVLYEIVHRATESLQRAATNIKRSSTIMDAQLFLIKNLMLIENLFMTHEIPDSIRQSSELDFSPIWETIRELQARRQLFNPLAYINPLVKGHLVPAVIDRVLDARKEMEKVLVQQITAFTKYWRNRLVERNAKNGHDVAKTTAELEALLDKVFEEETTKVALWRMIKEEEDGWRSQQ